MRFHHKAGEKLFVDYCGPTLPVVNRTTGEVREAQIFVAVLGASSDTYVEATWTQRLPDWTASHVRAFSYFGGVTEIVVPDNLASGVSKACRYEPDINPTYQDLAAHYGLAVIPSRVVKIFHKGKRQASHMRSRHKGTHTTIKNHRPKSHQRYLQWTPSRIISWAEKTGEATADLMAAIMARRPHPEQGFRSCLGIMRLGKVYGDERLEAACKRALFIEAFSYKSIASILKTGLNQKPLPERSEQQDPIDHPNIRGSHYYH